MKAYNTHSTNLSLKETMKTVVLLVHQWEGGMLVTEHGGPVRMITPQLYAWKGAKWIGEFNFRGYDKLGLWEQRGHSILLNHGLMVSILNHLHPAPLPILTRSP